MYVAAPPNTAPCTVPPGTHGPFCLPFPPSLDRLAYADENLIVPGDVEFIYTQYKYVVWARDDKES